jgi:hypothetical protein
MVEEGGELVGTIDEIAKTGAPAAQSAPVQGSEPKVVSIQRGGE